MSTPSPTPTTGEEGQSPLVPKSGFPSLPDVLALSCGWIYFFAWSLSFYPQCILNYRRKSVRGLSLDYVLLNVTGFLCYTIFTLLLIFSERTRWDYLQDFGDEPEVEVNDAIFATHGFVLCLFTLFQCFIYEGDPNERARPLILAMNFIVWGSVIITAILIAAKKTDSAHLVVVLGVGKIFCSFVKYVPQVMLNFQRKSTQGWALNFVLLDFSGGVFSLLQQAIRAVQKSSLSPFTSNIAKTGLALETLLFDSMFLVQHCVLYRGNVAYVEPTLEEQQEFMDPVYTDEEDQD